MSVQHEKKGYDILLAKKVVSAEDLDKAFEECQQTGAPLALTLARQGSATEAEILTVFANELNIPFANLKKAQVSPDIVQSVPVKVASHYHFFPFEIADGKMSIASSRLLDVGLLDEIRVSIGKEVTLVLALEGDIEEMLKRHYGLGAHTVDKILSQSPGRGQGMESQSVVEVENIEKMAETASVVQLVNQIILDAFQKNASDIHLEPYRGKVRLRYRIDGVLHEAQVPPEMRKFFMSILSRIKIMANLNIVERRLPQDGKARVKTQDQTLDLRISSIPTAHGESMVIRILPSRMIRTLNEVGWDKVGRNIFKELLSRPYGIIFVTGPTGSGKSTSLYAGLNMLNESDRKIITIEDPVEYELEGITQIQVNPEIGLTFSRGLRSMLRHDPDVMMVGEVRDLETADIAIRVALTGHLILSTLHTNDAASGVTRLLDIGVEPYLISSSVIAFMAQRLVRVICPACKEEVQDIAPELKQMISDEWGMGFPEEIKIHKGRGCDDCNGTGFSGRTAIYELLLVNEDIRQLIFNRESGEEIKRAARRIGMKTLRQDGWQKVLAGMTTPDEVLRVAPADEPFLEETFRSRSKEETAAGVIKPGSRQSEPMFEMPRPAPPQPVNISESRSGGTSFGGGQERRAYQRVMARLPMTYRVVEIDESGPPSAIQIDDTEDTRTEDISANGVAFASSRELLPGMLLDLKIQIDKDQEPLEVMAKVVRVTRSLSPTNEGAPFLLTIGSTFLAINTADRTRLEKYVNKSIARIQDRTA